MSDLFLFVIGTIVTAMVGSAVALLFYGAAKEPRGGPFRAETTDHQPYPTARRRAPSSRSHRAQRSWTRSF